MVTLTFAQEQRTVACDAHTLLEFEVTQPTLACLGGWDLFASEGLRPIVRWERARTFLKEFAYRLVVQEHAVFGCVSDTRILFCEPNLMDESVLLIVYVLGLGLVRCDLSRSGERCFDDRYLRRIRWSFGGIRNLSAISQIYESVFEVG